jgi:hypothetical protein
MVHGEKEMSCVEKKKVKAVWKVVLTLIMAHFVEDINPENTAEPEK